MSPENNETPLGMLESLETKTEPSEYDKELAEFDGEDAIRVWKGELSEEEFYELYDEAFREEFGDDYVPPEGFDDE